MPCFVFGETETYNQSGPLAQVWNRLTCSVRSCFGIAPVFFSGIECPLSSLLASIYWKLRNLARALDKMIVKTETFRSRMDSGKSWFSPKKEEVEGGDGQAHGGKISY